MKKILTFIGKSLLSTLLVSLFCWTCFGGMSGMSAMAMNHESHATTIQCADSACGTSNTMKQMTARCAMQCLTKATEGAVVSTVSLEGASVALVGETASVNEWSRGEVIEKTQRTLSFHRQRMFAVQRE